MASDEDVATALKDFARALLQSSSEGAPANPLSEERQGERRKQLKGLSERVEAMASDPSTATYLGFAAVWTEAQELGIEVPREITMAVASAFMQRPHVTRVSNDVAHSCATEQMSAAVLAVASCGPTTRLRRAARGSFSTATTTLLNRAGLVVVPSRDDEALAVAIGGQQPQLTVGIAEGMPQPPADIDAT